MRTILPLLLAGLFAAIPATATTYYSTTFESLANGALAGQDGWQSDKGPVGNVAVQSTTAKSGTKGLVLDTAGSQDGTRAYRTLAQGATAVSFDFQFGTTQVGLDHNYRFGLLDTVLGRLAEVAFTPQDGNVYLITGGAYPAQITLSRGVWYNVLVTLNFPTGTATLYINGIPRVAAPFSTTPGNYFYAIAPTLIPFDPSSSGQAYIDNIIVTDTPAPYAASIAVVSSTNNRSTTVNTAFSTNLQAQVFDQNGNPFPGVDVTFGADQGSFASNADVTVNSSGIATASVYTANTTAGPNAPTATVAGSNPALQATFSLTNLAGPATVISAMGTAQNATVNTAFTNPLMALVRDQYGNPVAGATVTFNPSGAGTIAGGNTGITNGSGVATSGIVTAGTTAGTYIPTATTGSLSTQLPLLNVRPGPAVNITPQGAPQLAPVTQPFANPLSAKVTDSFGNPVPDVSVTFAANGAGTIGGSSSSLTSPAGIATSNTVVAGTTAGVFTPTASISAATANLPQLTVRPGSPSSLTALGTAQTAAAGTAFTSPLQAKVTDSFNNSIQGVVVTFSSAGAGPIAGGDTAVTDTSGIATSGVVTARTTPGGPFTPTASATNLGPTSLPTLTVNPGAPATITPLGAPQSAQVTNAFPNRLQAKVTDSFGNPVPGVTVTFGSGGAGSFSFGPTAVTGSNGIAESSNLVAGTVSGLFTPTASTASLSAVNLPQVTVRPGEPAGLESVSGTPQSVAVYTAFAPLVVKVVDVYGNVVPNVTVTYSSPALTGASAVFSNGTNTISLLSNSNGQVSASCTANQFTGSYQVRTTFTPFPSIAQRAPGAAPRSANVVNFALQNLPNPITVTVVTNITGPTVTANATTFTGTRVFTGVFNQGDPFTITTTSPQAFNAGQSQYVFLNGPNGNAATTQNLTLPFQPTVTYTMNFLAQHQVTFNTLPPAGGTINPVGTAFYDQGTVVNVLANANPNFAFAGFSGLLGGATNPQSLTVSAPGTVTANFIPPDSYHIRYVSHLNLGDSVINLTNSGARGAGLAAGTTANTTGALCANVYAFSPDEQMISCCSCPVTPNSLVSLSARQDLISNTLTPAVPTSIVVKLLASVPDATNGCNNSASTVAVNNLASGLLAWGTTLKPGLNPVPDVVETRFVPATLSIGNGGNNVGELGRLQQLCNFINANGSGFGVCRSCRLGGLGAGRQ